jgi:hypothetical protein
MPDPGWGRRFATSGITIIMTLIRSSGGKRWRSVHVSVKPRLAGWFTSGSSTIGVIGAVTWHAALVLTWFTIGGKDRS